MREAADYEAVTTVTTVGLKERTSTGIPGWMTALFVVLPLAALTYLISFSTGPNCGTAGVLAVDRQSGAAVNCDGTEYVAGGAAGGVDPRTVLASGEALYTAAPGNCAACHGGAGGGGTGPALAGGAVVSTFASCSDHIEWVSLGSSGFQAAGRSTYGDGDKPIAGGMPPFGSLSPDDLAAVVVFERVRFGQQDPAEALVDCGLVEPEGEDGEPPAESTEAEALGR
jgi:mono/diheme cytochrome c family protein